MKRNPQAVGKNQPINDLVKEVRTNGMNTREIMTKLCRVFYNIPAAVPDNHPTFKTIVGLDATSSHMSTDINRPSRISAATGTIQAHLDELGKTKVTQPLQQSYVPAFTGLKAESFERVTEREALQRQVSDYVNKLQQTLPKIVEQMAQGTGDTRQMNETLEELAREKKNLSARIAKLNINERFLQSKLDAMVRETLQVVVAARGGYQVAPSFTPPTYD